MIRKLGRCDPVTEIPQPTDWDKLFDGGIYQCDEGEDYHCPTTTFLEIVRFKAAQRGVSINLEYTEDGNGFVVQRI